MTDGQTYFLPAHILSGNASVGEGSGVEYAWLTREEIEERLEEGGEEDKAYWEAVGKLLAA